MSNGKATIIFLTVGLIKKYRGKMGEYFPEPKFFGRRVKVKLDLPNYATKADLKMTQVLIHQNLLNSLI